jgi:catalase (peroxidase I)
VEDPDFRKVVEIYAKDEKKFFSDFAKAYAKLTELGCRNLE